MVKSYLGNAFTKGICSHWLFVTPSIAIEIAPAAAVYGILGRVSSTYLVTSPLRFISPFPVKNHSTETGNSAIAEYINCRISIFGLLCLSPNIEDIVPIGTPDFLQSSDLLPSKSSFTTICILSFIVVIAHNYLETI